MHSTAQPRFTVSSDGLTVLDTQTQLTWTRDDAADEDVTHDEAEAAIDTLNADRFAGFDDWRLPSIDELFALADRTRHYPAIDTGAFPNCQSAWYWTATPWAASPSLFAWIVDFYYGHAYADHRDLRGRVRAVRGASSPRQ